MAAKCDFGGEHNTALTGDGVHFEQKFQCIMVIQYHGDAVTSCVQFSDCGDGTVAGLFIAIKLELHCFNKSTGMLTAVLQ